MNNPQASNCIPAPGTGPKWVYHYAAQYQQAPGTVTFIDGIETSDTYIDSWDTYRELKKHIASDGRDPSRLTVVSLTKLGFIPGADAYAGTTLDALAEFDKLTANRPHWRIEVPDLNGTLLAEGDTVVGYAMRYETKKIIDDGMSLWGHETGDIPMYEEFRDKPKPLADVPLFKGTVRFDPCDLAFRVDIVELYVDWGNDTASVAMGGGHYVYEKC